MNDYEVKVQTITRTTVLAVALVNQCLAIGGRNTLPIYESDVAQLISLIATLASAVWAWWKNNSFSDEAIRADAYLDALREKDEKDK